MQISAELYTEIPKAQERRAQERSPVSLSAGFRKSGYDASQVEVRDLSTTGCKIDCSINVGKGMAVWIKFPNFQPMHAVVVWVHGFEAGCEFSTPFYPPVLEHFLSRQRTA